MRGLDWKNHPKRSKSPAQILFISAVKSQVCAAQQKKCGAALKQANNRRSMASGMPSRYSAP